jgi:predicted phage terminase large subunit-like protein
MFQTEATGRAHLPSVLAIDTEIERRSKTATRLHTEQQFEAERKRHSAPDGEGLMNFIRYFWRVLEPNTELIEGWPLEAICEHLDAVTRGDLTKLLINVPPGFMKSLLVDVFWPAWEWGPVDMPHMRYVTFSYSPSITERDNAKFRNLIVSEQYQQLYGERFALTKLGQGKIENNRTGFKLASSIGGVGTGERGTRVILDDPHNVKDIESETVRKETIRWLRESMSNRLNDMETSAIVIIMQRLHMEDVSGEILSREFAYCHLMIPMEFDPSRYPVSGVKVTYTGNDIGWVDPRALDEEGELLSPHELDDREGMLAWPERFSPAAVESLKFELGPFAYAGQYGQTPMPRKGGIFDLSWWNLWEPPPNGKFPPMDFIVGSLDSAFTEKEQNDPSGFTVWGVYIDSAAHQAALEKSLALGKVMSPDEVMAGFDPELFEGQTPRVMLMHAWRRHLRIHGDNLPKRKDETYDKWVARTRKHWGLCEWVAHSCKTYGVDLLLIEAKASGLDVIHEMERIYKGEKWAVRGVPAPKDKVSRAIAVQPCFSQGIVYAPARDWAEMVKEEMAMFPKHKYKDLTDSATHALSYLRNNGLIQRPEEIARLVRARAELKKPPPVLYHA